MTIGEMLGGNMIYQPWNVIGHIIPALFLVLYKTSKLEVAIAAILISTVVMDTPVWGAEVLYLHPNQQLPMAGNSTTPDLWEWSKFYYNPIGTYGVWGDPPPSAALIFWSMVGRIGLAVFMIWYQIRWEKVHGETSLNKFLMNKIKETFKKDMDGLR